MINLYITKEDNVFKLRESTDTTQPAVTFEQLTDCLAAARAQSKDKAVKINFSRDMIHEIQDAFFNKALAEDAAKKISEYREELREFFKIIRLPWYPVTDFTQLKTLKEHYKRQGFNALQLAKVLNDVMHCQDISPSSTLLHVLTRIRDQAKRDQEMNAKLAELLEDEEKEAVIYATKKLYDYIIWRCEMSKTLNNIKKDSLK